MSKCLLDYRHSPVWCPECYEEQQQDRMIAALDEANALKRRELELRDLRSEEENYWIPAPKPVRYVPTPVKQQEQPKSSRRGGMNIEPQ